MPVRFGLFANFEVEIGAVGRAQAPVAWIFLPQPEICWRFRLCGRLFCSARESPIDHREVGLQLRRRQWYNQLVPFAFTLEKADPWAAEAD